MTLVRSDSFRIPIEGIVGPVSTALSREDPGMPTQAFWTIESIEVVNIFTYGTQAMISYPMHIYQTWIRRFFTFVLPAIFINYYPALFFLDRTDPLGLPPAASGWLER